MKKRARRRGDLLRMKQRAYFWHKYILKYEEDTITPDRIGRSAANHCTHDCKMCNHWKHDGRNERPFSEHRKGIPDEID